MIAAGVRTGKVSRVADAGALAAYIMTVIQGLSTLAREGATRTKLKQVAQLALAVWPSQVSQKP